MGLLHKEYLRAKSNAICQQILLIHEIRDKKIYCDNQGWITYLLLKRIDAKLSTSVFEGASVSS